LAGCRNTAHCCLWQILADGLDKALLRLGLEHGKFMKHVVDLDQLDWWIAGANGMDSTELMRELNSSIDMLMDSENYLLALNESMNQV
jgi:hypothetical protein